MGYNPEKPLPSKISLQILTRLLFICDLFITLFYIPPHEGIHTILGGLQAVKTNIQVQCTISLNRDNE